jgi:hypothetical protein
MSGKSGAQRKAYRANDAHYVGFSRLPRMRQVKQMREA